jgi:hypothetical protein
MEQAERSPFKISLGLVFTSIGLKSKHKWRAFTLRRNNTKFQFEKVTTTAFPQAAAV